MKKRRIEVISPDNFEQENHFYPKALNAQLHPMVSHFLNLDHERIINRYKHLNPKIDSEYLRSALKLPTKHFFWGGADLFYVTTQQGNRKMVVLETNSCPSGQKSMPPRNDSDEFRGYRYLIENSFLPLLKKKRLPKGALAIIYDKNYMEVSGYAATLAEVTGEDVFLVPHFNNEQQFISIENGILSIEYDGSSIPIRAAFRYVTQKPWNRLPVNLKTFVYNSTLVCLSGGRNKLLANKAYELYNSELHSHGLKINMPETIKDVNKLEIPLWVDKFGGKAVIKNPYSNAGQGVYTITTQDELESFMNEKHEYDQFIVQSLIGHYEWSSISNEGKFFHIGTVPNKKGNIYIADLRVMVYSSPKGFFPCAIYARRAIKPLTENNPKDSWEVLGTNLSVKKGENTWDSDTSRLMLMDNKDFNSLGVGVDDLIEAYIQTVLSITAIDKMAQTLLNKKGLFRTKLFKSLDNDQSLLSEIRVN
ncbi:MAG: hypothetical protein N4A33_11785 [Bacteriovoracaceae bacterium]|jgi:hypothetical protein|nr:hypothetical protein [Bacteriovoracaceae bacterium]